MIIIIKLKGNSLKSINQAAFFLYIGGLSLVRLATALQIECLLESLLGQCFIFFPPSRIYRRKAVSDMIVASND